MQLSPHNLRELAVRAVVHPKTAVAYLAGRAVRSTTKRRMDVALRELGWSDAHNERATHAVQEKR